MPAVPQRRYGELVPLRRCRNANVDSISDGFKAVQTEYGPNFHCGACNVPVDL
jgi:hypothetical protein